MTSKCRTLSADKECKDKHQRNIYALLLFTWTQTQVRWSAGFHIPPLDSEEISWIKNEAGQKIWDTHHLSAGTGLKSHFRALDSSVRVIIHKCRNQWPVVNLPRRIQEIAEGPQTSLFTDRASMDLGEPEGFGWHYIWSNRNSAFYN